MINQAFADRFTQAWLTAWNQHDIEAITRLYHENCVIKSPLINFFKQEAHGELHGRDLAVSYWTAALQRLPGLHFTPTRSLPGVDSVVICYKAILGAEAVEVFYFDQGLVREAVAHYHFGALGLL